MTQSTESKPLFNQNAFRDFHYQTGGLHVEEFLSDLKAVLDKHGVKSIRVSPDIEGPYPFVIGYEEDGIFRMDGAELTGISSREEEPE